MGRAFRLPTQAALCSPGKEKFLLPSSSGLAEVLCEFPQMPVSLESVTVWGLTQIPAVPGRELKEEGIGSWKGTQAGKDKNSAGSGALGQHGVSLLALHPKNVPAGHTRERSLGMGHRGWGKEPKVQERIIWMEVLRSEGQEGQSLGLQGMSGKLCWR